MMTNIMLILCWLSIIILSSSNDIDTLISLAYKEANAGNIAKAANSFYDAAMLASNDIKIASQLFFNSAHAYSQVMDYNNAIKSYKKCLDISNNRFRPCHIKIASVYRDIEDNNNCQKHLLIAIDMEPSNPDAYSYLAQILNNIKQFNKSITYYEAAITRSPNDPNLYTHVGDTYSNTRQAMKALNSYKKGLELSQKNTLSYINALIGVYFTCLDLLIWKNYEQYTSALISNTNIQLDQYKKGKAPPSPLPPYRLLFMSTSPELFLEIASSWSNELVKNTLALSIPLKYTKALSSETLNIGYISRRFEDYPGTQMMLRIFKSHNRQKGLKIHSFAHGPSDGSMEREVVKSTSDVFEDISSYSFQVAAQTIAHYDIDILIDYDGIHDFNNIKVLALRPAKVQVTWLGFAGTTGQGYRLAKKGHPHKVETIEYIITDRFLSPPDRRFSRFYSEHMVMMPRTYQPQDGERLLTRSLYESKHDQRMILLSKYFPTRRQHEVITSSKWLTCFNRPGKITPDAFEDWMMILKRKSNTYLVLMVEADEAKNETLKQAQYWGVDPNRLLIFKRVPRNEYYTILATSDLFLDSRHYGSHTVASDAMLYNVPVVTVTGNSFASRVAHSLNAATKVDTELVYHSRRSFVDNVIRIISDENILIQISKKLSKSIGSCIYNDVEQAANLEQAYTALYELNNIQHHKHIFFSASSLC